MLIDWKFYRIPLNDQQETFKIRTCVKKDMTYFKRRPPLNFLTTARKLSGGRQKLSGGLHIKYYIIWH